jgi:DNA-binding IclR family transcriptional regulator
LSALRTADATMTPAELVAATGMKLNNLNQLLHRMGENGEIQKIKRGYYIHPDRTDLIPADPDKIDKNNKKPK